MGRKRYYTDEGRSVMLTVHSAKARCVNAKDPGFRHYGGRGITFDLGSNREAVAYILEAIGPRPPGMSLDRIDNSRGYAKGNVRWATAGEQARNRRKETESRDGLVPLARLSDGVLAWPEASKRMNYWTFRDRLRRGWSADRAAFEPVRRYSKRRVQMDLFDNDRS